MGSGGGGSGGLSDFGQKAIHAAVRGGMVFRGSLGSLE